MAGFAVEVPQLPGHGTDHAMLGRTRWPDWVGGANRARLRLVERLGPSAPIGICGLSMGGLVALELARVHGKEIRAIAGLSVALHLTPSLERPLALVSRVPLLRSISLPKLGGSDVLDAEMKERNQRLQRGTKVAIPALLSLVDFGAHIAAKLSEITTPLLLMHGRQDHTIPFSCMAEIARGVASASVEQIALERSYHLITIDVERDRVCREVVRYFETNLA